MEENSMARIAPSMKIEVLYLAREFPSFFASIGSLIRNFIWVKSLRLMWQVRIHLSFEESWIFSM